MNKSKPEPHATEPQIMDILCGRNKRCADSEGNARYRYCIERFRHKYASAMTKHDKTGVTREIYETLKATGARFLKFNSSLQVWEELSARAERDKVGHALRFANRGNRRDMPPTSAQLVSTQSSNMQPTTMLGHASSLAPLCEARSQPQHMIDNPDFAASHHRSILEQDILPIPINGSHHAVQQIMCQARSAASSESGTTGDTGATANTSANESANTDVHLSTSKVANICPIARHPESTSLTNQLSTSHHMDAFVAEWMELTERDSQGAPPISCDSFRIPERSDSTG